MNEIKVAGTETERSSVGEKEVLNDCVLLALALTRQPSHGPTKDSNVSAPWEWLSRPWVKLRGIAVLLYGLSVCAENAHHSKSRL